MIALIVLFAGLAATADALMLTTEKNRSSAADEWEDKMNVAAELADTFRSSIDDTFRSSVDWLMHLGQQNEDSDVSLRNASAIHLTMLTDRQDGAAAALESVCRNAAEPSRLNFHIIGPSASSSGAARWRLSSIAPSCAAGGASMRVYSLDEMTQRVKDAGYKPVWLWDWNIERTNYSIHPALWDNSTTHNDPFNILRFYLPHVKPFTEMKQVLFMDDDVILQGDVAKAWDYQLHGDAVMSASCHNWVWSDCDRFESSTKLSYLDVPYLGFGRLGAQRSAEEAACKTEFERECIPDGFFEFLSHESTKINGKKHAVTLDNLQHSIAWNYGFNKFDLDAFRQRQVTQKYVKWMQLNHKYNLFPSTSLSYGLGVPMLANLGHIQCFDDVTPVVQGLGFVGPKDMRGAGHYAQELKQSFGMHFNGPRKPWDTNAGNPYSQMYLQYAHKNMKKAAELALSEHHAKRAARARFNATSFVVMTDPRSGSEWFMEMLDQHQEICASGEASDGAEGFPREALIPARYGHMQAQRDAAHLAAAHAALRNHTIEQIADRTGTQGPISLLSMSGAVSARTAVPRNYYTPSPPETSLRAKRNGFNGLTDASHEKVGGFSACQLKAGCSWGFMANLVWKAAKNPKICEGNENTLAQRSETYGFGEHLRMVCHLRRSAEKNVKETHPHPTAVQLTQAAFQIFFRHQMRESLRLNDATYGSKSEDHQLMACKCPRTALVTGQKVMHDWIGDLPMNGAAARDWRQRPADVNYNADAAAQKLGTPYYDLIGAMKELGTAAILFERENLLARFVSLQAASQSNIYHCDDPRCVEAAAKQSVLVDVSEMRKFVRWNRRMHRKNHALLQAAGVKTLHIKYEDCRENTAACMEQVADFLGVDTPTEDLASATKSIRLINNLRNQITNADEVEAALREDGDGAWLE